MILIPILAITALVMKVDFTSARNVICSDESQPLTLKNGDVIEIQSPDYPKKYPNKVECGWIVKPIGPEDVRIACLTFEMEKPNKKKKCDDFLQINAKRYCGKIDRFEVTVRPEKLIKLRFVSDKNKSGGGFQCTVSAISDYGKRVHASFLLKNKEYNDKLADPKSIEYAEMETLVYESVGAALKEDLGTTLLRYEITNFEDGSLNRSFRGETEKRPRVNSVVTSSDPKKTKTEVEESLTSESESESGSETSLSEISVEDINECAWKWKELTKIKIPLILWNGQIVHPQQYGDDFEIRVPDKTVLTIACPGIHNSFLSLKKTLAVITVQCIMNNAGKMGLKWKGQMKQMKDLGCTNLIATSIKKLEPEVKCGPPAAVGILQHVIEYQFTLDSIQQSYPLINVCYDSNKEATIWTKHTLYGNRISARDTGDISENWNFDKKKELETSYEVIQQSQMFFDMEIELQAFRICICKDGKHIFSRGHMSPNGDFITKADRKATYHYMNAVPQWLEFNNGNWRNIEEGMRKLAKPVTDNRNDGKELTIITGGFGILHMKKQDGINWWPIYLKNGFEQLPAPVFTWKLVYERSSRKAVGFIVTNNPNPKLTFGDMDIDASVTDLCDTDYSEIFEKKDKKGDIEYTNKKQERGYTYCLTYDDLRKIVESVPEGLDVTGGLLKK